MNRTYITIAVSLLLATSSYAEEWTLTSPGLSGTPVDEHGTLHEDWGRVELKLAQAQSRTVEFVAQPFPVASVRQSADGVEITQHLYRAPVWPRGMDVIEAVVRNSGDEPRQATLELDLPEGVVLGEAWGMLDDRRVVLLPQDIDLRQQWRSWGCATPTRVMKGWAAPQGNADPAFKSIRVGMEGTPIIYKFQIGEGEKCSVAVGLCEGHWKMAGQRPLEVYVEGAAMRAVDPVSEWGYQVAGVLAFEGQDSNKDGYVQIVVASPEDAPDRNTILNALWIFPHGTWMDPLDIVAGKMNDHPKRFVDVGGENDQSLFESGSMHFRLALQPRQERPLLFMLQCPGGGSLPLPDDHAWTSARLREAAAAVSRDWTTHP